MKKLFILLLILPTFSFAQNQLDEYFGKWEEISRTIKNKNQDFEDTIRIDFQKGNFTIIRYDIGPTLIGNAILDGKEFTLRSKQFQIKKESDERITLLESDVIHNLRKVEEFRNAPILRKIPSLENEIKVQIKKQDMTGKWTCYKKTDSMFNKSKFYIKNINLKNKISETEYLGSITYQNMDTAYINEITFHIERDFITINSNEPKDSYKIEMLFDNEMILLKESAIFYLKLLGQ